jgi:hypothetical protein
MTINMTMKTPTKSDASSAFGPHLHSPSSERRRHLRQRQVSHGNSPYRYHEESNSRNHHNILSLRLQRLIVPVSLGGLLLVYSVISNYVFTVNMILQQQQGPPVSDRPLSLSTDSYYHRHEQSDSQNHKNISTRGIGLLLGGKHQNRSGDADGGKGKITNSLHAAAANSTTRTSTLPKTDTKTSSPTTANITATDTASSIILDLDKAAPTIMYGVTHFLTSVPARNRLPVTALANLTAYFLDRQHVYPAAEYFFEYNPSIVRLPASNQRQLVQQHSLFQTAPLYLASYRVTNTQQCVTDDMELAP